jgi:hypothetical protein
MFGTVRSLAGACLELYTRFWSGDRVLFVDILDKVQK